MNNYSDLLATDVVITLELRLQPVVQNGAPHCLAIMNGHTLFNQPLTHPVCLVHTVPLLEPVSVCITMRDKIYDSDRETAIVIRSLRIDDFDVVPRWSHLASYQNDQCQDQPSEYLGFNGTWHFATNAPFYIWRHAVTAQGWLLEPTTTVRD